jgi:hypothetical protein
MKRRHLYPLMYALPVFVFSVILMVVATAGLAGVLWIFVYGDNPWPAYLDQLAPIFMGTVFLGTWLGLIWTAYRWGQRQESLPFFNKKHAYVAIGATVALALAVFSHQRSVGNIGPKSDVLVCSDYCTAGKFPASRFPQDGTCRCYGSDGSEALNILMSKVRMGTTPPPSLF